MKILFKDVWEKWLNKHKSFGLHATCLAAAWAGKNNFCYHTSPQIQYHLFLQTNSMEILVVKGKDLKEHRVRGKKEVNGEKLFTKMKLRTGSAGLTQYSRKSRWWINKEREGGLWLEKKNVHWYAKNGAVSFHNKRNRGCKRECNLKR